MGKNLKNILLLGGLGYLGGRIAKYLSDNNYSVKITTRERIEKTSVKYDQNIKVMPLLYNSEIQFNEVFKDIDCLIFLIGPDAHSNNRFGENKILDYSNFSKRIIKYAELNEINKIIYFSTVHVYGKNLIGSVDETTDPRPIHSFAIDHHNVEKIILEHSKKTKPIILRCSNSFGVPYFNNEKCWSLVMNYFCDSAFKNKSLTVKSGNSFRDFIPLGDITKVVKQLIELKGHNSPKIFNLSSSNTIRIIDAARMIQNRLEKYFNYSIPIIEKSNNDRSEEKDYFIIKNNLLKSLAFLPNTIDEELDRLLYLCKTRYN